MIVCTKKKYHLLIMVAINCLKCLHDHAGWKSMGGDEGRGDGCFLLTFNRSS